MSSFEFVAATLLLVSLLGMLNHRYIKLPPTIGLMAGSLVLSLIILLADRLISALDLRQSWLQILESTDMPHVFLDRLLAFMLFAGSLHVDVDQLIERKWTVLLLATLSVALATLLYGVGIYIILGGTVPLAWCLTLGAVLAPTDPIAVGGLLRDAGLPAGMLAIVNGESLFNDGVAVVLFGAMLLLATGQTTSSSELLIELLQEGGGGALLGFITGYIAYRALRLVDDPTLELTITLALVTITYSVASQIHVSGPLAVVVAGLLTGHHATRFAMTDASREQVIQFWDLMDSLLNAVLFLLMGFALLSVELSPSLLFAAVAGVVLAMLTRLVSVSLPIAMLLFSRAPKTKRIAILTWGGLRGGISIAMVLALEPSLYRATMLAICYAVVVWTILVQGLTMPALVRRLYPPATEEVPR